MTKVDDCGVVTLADAAYFPGLEMMHRSVQESFPVPVVCFDAGLTESQRQRASDISNLVIRPLPSVELIERAKHAFEAVAPLGKANKRVWPLWICPALIAAAPFRRVFWIDCDAFVLRGLRKFFSILDDGPVFTPENNSPEQTPNRRELYDLLPIHRSFDPSEPRVNGGVSGWDLVRDSEPLQAYGDAVMRACEDFNIASAISWHDQGALIWAIQKTGLEHRVLATSRWNLCVRHTPAAADPPPWDEGFLDALREACPDTNILHWNGVSNPWSVNTQSGVLDAGDD